MLVVVGVDGSPNSQAALRWAADYAGRFGAALRGVVAYGQFMPGFGFAPLSSDELRREALDGLDKSIEHAFGGAPPLPVERVAVNGHPAAVLVDASKDADLLVVGDRGYGGFAELLLGSIGEQAVRRAHCSVVVVRAQPGPTTRQSSPATPTAGADADDD
jgi:nucleotide-binding universal stress UspA family protein